ncbi:hypothetical protein DFH09DRAFT_1070591 [Mycena vulgaris]|nr:hypothetical protein DFH09DRAFT_1070591 [Mycena vulgaris]
MAKYQMPNAGIVSLSNGIGIGIGIDARRNSDRGARYVTYLSISAVRYLGVHRGYKTVTHAARVRTTLRGWSGNATGVRPGTRRLGCVNVKRPLSLKRGLHSPDFHRPHSHLTLYIVHPQFEARVHVVQTSNDPSGGFIFRWSWWPWGPDGCRAPARANSDARRVLPHICKHAVRCARPTPRDNTRYTIHNANYDRQLPASPPAHAFPRRNGPTTPTPTPRRREDVAAASASALAWSARNQKAEGGRRD